MWFYLWYLDLSFFRIFLARRWCDWCLKCNMVYNGGWTSRVVFFRPILCETPGFLEMYSGVVVELGRTPGSRHYLIILSFYFKTINLLFPPTKYRTLEQHRFELDRSTYICGFCFVSVNVFSLLIFLITCSLALRI